MNTNEELSLTKKNNHLQYIKLSSYAATISEMVAVSFFADEEIIIIFVDYDFYNNTKIIIA